MSRQRDRLVNAASAKDLTAPIAVRLLHFLREGRGAGANCGGSEALPVQRDRVDLVGDLVDFAAVALGHGEIREGKLGGFERVIVIGGLELAELLVVVVELVVGKVLAGGVLEEAGAVGLELFGGLGDEIFDVADALEGKA